MPESITAFDGIALAVVVISAIMGFARGFLRELATLGAFIGAMAAAIFTGRFFFDDLNALLPPEWPPIVTYAILNISAFLIVYAVIAWLGQRLSKNIQGADGIGMFDHFAGAGFGILRGLVALVFFVVLLGLVLDENRVPGFIQNGVTYPPLRQMADYVNVEAGKVGKDVQESLPKEEETGH
ncbi:MAG: CvpA family protein [Hyphomonas sp.]|nr:CvpA family protein [Hyphomonas sp.]MCB9962740.1 CvpA family protein [Hyphomonas sp.]MCB9969960.1 CvpA family protein [Hyphomonas sp.]